jgi:hypothetical protein
VSLCLFLGAVVVVNGFTVVCILFDLFESLHVVTIHLVDLSICEQFYVELPLYFGENRLLQLEHVGVGELGGDG